MKKEPFSAYLQEQRLKSSAKINDRPPSLPWWIKIQFFAWDVYLNLHFRKRWLKWATEAYAIGAAIYMEYLNTFWPAYRESFGAYLFDVIFWIRQVFQ